MSTNSAGPVSASELRRRVRAAEALKAKTREMAAANALTSREAAVKAAKEKDEADVTAREAAAVVLRLFDNDAELVSELLGVPAEELEREAKPVTAARAKEIIEALRARAERPPSTRTRKPRADAVEAASLALGAPAPAVTADGSRADAA
ncbi:hypothetical protein [Streptomyces scabiei]|uniref:hypothetical protein n=1 Tax=Streptomyces scabiei TaxID=1930 RepID=UPI0029BE04D2|nr:hypothetical protein [Streptomyces scabiei]MDX2538833.1 hypothetical protein [Streptomyces scabiei]MDX2802347.1 hypothetical protein [Streptomyces scabiei]MDX2861589.1 hypothetical protein [Streptomyces scabiei]MDX3828991.1 hypothetical protein [Streptomyces scabiei]